jgi:hypothetical protein
MVTDVISEPPTRRIPEIGTAWQESPPSPPMLIAAQTDSLFTGE